MARTFAEETVELSNTVGTGSYTLEGPKGSYFPLSATFTTGEKPAYVVRNRTNTKSEYNRGGALTIGPPDTLARGVWKSTNGNAAVSWTSDDLPLTITIPSSAELHEGVVTGWLAAARHALIRAGAMFFTSADVAVEWIHKLATGDSTQVRVGYFDVAKDGYFPDARRPWTATGTSGKTVAAADIGGVFTFNNAAAERVFTLPAQGADGIGHGFKVGGLGLTGAGGYAIVVTPDAGDGIEGGADGVARRIPGGVRFDVEWDQPSDTWRIVFLNTTPVTAGARRQTVAAGPVDSSGLPNFLATASGLTLTTQNVSVTSPMVFCAAGGFGITGAINRIAVVVANIAWTLADASSLYLYVDIDSNGNVTQGSTTTAPVYQFGGTYSTTSGAYTFNIVEMTGKLGNGSTAAQVWRVFVGEATTSGGNITAVVPYAYNGRYDSGYTATLPSAGVATSKNHNLGLLPFADLRIECTTTDAGYAVGDSLGRDDISGYNGAQSTVIAFGSTAKAMSMMTSGNPYQVLHKSTGAVTNLTVGSWKYKFIADRGW